MGRYVIEGLLGPGGVTETYLAQLPEEPGKSKGEPGQLYALKLLRRDRVPEGIFVEAARRFVAAARQLLGFHRPGLGRVVDVSDDPAATFVVTEHVAGYDLARLLEMSQAETQARSGMDPALVGLLGAEIARFLHVGHMAKPSLPHLGLAPQNVTVTEEGEVVLLDAGISAALRAITEQPPERWWFVAPELHGVDTGASAVGERQGVAADLWSLGGLLGFLVTGQSPSQTAQSAGQVGAWWAPRSDLPGASSKLNAAVRSLLAPAAEDRPESAAVLVEWLSGGVDSARERQRLIAEGLRRAETEARKAAAAAARQAGRGTPVPPTKKVFFTLVPATSQAPFLAGAEDADTSRGVLSLARTRRRVLVLLVALVAVAGAAALALLGGTGGRSPATPRVLASIDGAKAGAKTRSFSSEEGPAEGQSSNVERSARARILSHIAGHLIAETVPPGATVWVDGVAKGKTFADVVVGKGRHRIVLTAPGYRMFRDDVDTDRGAIIRRNLVPAPPPAHGSGLIRVECQSVGHYPILLDDEETGLLCPSLQVPAAIGRHTVGIYLPATGRVVSVGVTVEPGPRPAVARFAE